MKGCAAMVLDTDLRTHYQQVLHGLLQVLVSQTPGQMMSQAIGQVVLVEVVQKTRVYATQAVW